MKHINRNQKGFFKGKNWQIIRFGIVFVSLTFLVFYFLGSEFTDEGTYSRYLNVAIAHSVSFILRLFGLDARAVGTSLETKDLSVGIVSACNGMIVCIIYLAAVIAYPCKIKEKVIGVAIGIPIIEAINLVRVVCLFYVLRYFPASFETYHIYVAESIIIAFGVVLWLFWVERFVQVRRQ
ncbi:MAG TPA: archaeosortase/exosortase family protein [Candidatus Brocadiia bacterium]|nr:archaeosortase/exosortase family protein [Planctomycetota bacterium]MDO8093680.1 archaeosortase/exosortase family protein [Candidatus Brocadiales bacterium]